MPLLGIVGYQMKTRCLARIASFQVVGCWGLIDLPPDITITLGYSLELDGKAILLNEA